MHVPTYLLALQSFQSSFNSPIVCMSNSGFFPSVFLGNIVVFVAFFEKFLLHTVDVLKYQIKSSISIKSISLFNAVEIFFGKINELFHVIV